jgi:pimeloyl-ACP methyl ester carboxylesterase
MPTVKSADGVPIAYQTTGSGSPTLVFVHGWCCDRTYWDAQVPYFAPQYQVVSVDLAGHGESGLDRKEWTLEAFADDVVAVVKELDCKRSVIIGHSMGGYIVTKAALQIPERVVGLIGIDTHQYIEPTDVLQKAVDAGGVTLENFSQFMRQFTRSFFLPTSDPALSKKVIADMSSAPPQVGLAVIIGMADAYKRGIAGAFEQVSVPIRCINSSRNVVNLEVARRHARSFDVKYMTGVGHFVMMEDPTTFNRLLDETIKGMVSI